MSLDDTIRRKDGPRERERVRKGWGRKGLWRGKPLYQELISACRQCLLVSSHVCDWAPNSLRLTVVTKVPETSERAEISVSFVSRKDPHYKGERFDDTDTPVLGVSWNKSRPVTYELIIF